MNPRTLRELRQFEKTSQAKSWETYRRIVGRLCQAHSEEPWANTILGLVRNGNIRDLVDYADSLSEQKYSDAERHFSANQIAAIIRKYPFPSELADFQPEQKAMEKWHESEARCAKTNAYFDGFRHRESDWRILRKIIESIIGEVPSYKRVFKGCGFGPGASLGVHGNATNVARKIASDWSVTPSALNYAFNAIAAHWQFFEILLEERNGFMCVDDVSARLRFHSRTRFVHHNKIAFVPKTVKIHRPIAVEPLLNGYIQKGIDLYLRDCLKEIGIDLSDQSLNQKFAREGSMDDSQEGFVTIDLSSASDSVAKALVKDLLPYDWWYLLDNTRSRQYMLNGSDQVGTYEKFCSMGNGFCFPLETLLFTAACIFVGAGRPGIDFIVYGDDIIVRKRFSGDLITLLGDMGFQVNSGKTFLEGPFRESCGADWFGGEDVRPFTLDFRLDSLQSYFKFLNLSERNARSSTFFAPIREVIISDIPDCLRFCRPFDGNPDTAYRVELDKFMISPFAKWYKPFQCWEWSELISVAVQDDWRSLRNANNSHVMAALVGASSTSPFTVRRKTRTNVRRVAHG